MEKLILKKIAILNQVSMRAMRDENNTSIIKKFTEEGKKVLNADFSFAFEKINGSSKYELVYKSSHIPLNPAIPRRKTKNNFIKKRINILFDQNIKNKNYESGIPSRFKSYIIIPIRYGDHIFGSMIFYYRNQHDFTEEELLLAEVIEIMVSRAVNTNWLLGKEQEFLARAEKQKETEVLLSQEKSKIEFISNATHELRTPLAIMKGNVDLALLNKKNLKYAHGALKKINTEINSLSNILTNLSLITSPTSSSQSINLMNPTPINLIELINNLVKRLRAIALKKNINIKILPLERDKKNKKNEDLFTTGEERYLKRLFINLIRNAITYGKNNGNIIIDLSVEKNNIKIKISDDGIGIPKEDLPKIFDRFYRGDKAHTRDSSVNHSGLGLAIVKWVTEIHGGTIEVESVEGKGSIFTITLPRLSKS